MICPGGLHEMDQLEVGVYHCPLDGMLLITHSERHVRRHPPEPDDAVGGSPQTPPGSGEDERRLR